MKYIENMEDEPMFMDIDFRFLPKSLCLFLVLK